MGARKEGGEGVTRGGRDKKQEGQSKARRKECKGKDGRRRGVEKDGEGGKRRREGKTGRKEWKGKDGRWREE